MSLPFFYIEKIPSETSLLILNEETSKHIGQVLRMQIGEKVRLTDGKGRILVAIIDDNNKKKCSVKVISATMEQRLNRKISIAISLIKNSNRFEWFLEKATEIGVTEIIPLLCDRTEKQHFRYDRMKNILVSAMLQSQQCWLPHLHEPVQFLDFISKTNYEQQFIAHCVNDDLKKKITSQLINSSIDQLILIGPEGDFTDKEIQIAVKNNCIPVSLGNTRLRTETAGIAAAVMLMMI